MPVTKPSRRAFAALATGAALSITASPSRSQNRSQPMEATIRVDHTMTTLINVFSLDPDKRDALVAALKDGTDTFFSKQPGFISASVVAGRDGRQVINYSQGAAPARSRLSGAIPLSQPTSSESSRSQRPKASWVTWFRCAPPDQSMIPKSVKRFSEKIMLYP